MSMWRPASRCTGDSRLDEKARSRGMDPDEVRPQLGAILSERQVESGVEPMKTKRCVATGVVLVLLCVAGCQKQTEALPQEDPSQASEAETLPQADPPRESEAETQPQKDWPKTLDEASDRLIAGMSDEDQQTVRETKKDNLIQFHLGWGMGIRNSFGLWQGNQALLESCGGGHPDDASMVIIESVWKKLNEQTGSEKTPADDVVKAAAEE